MSFTPVSSLVSYVQPLDVLNRHDWRSVGQYLTDDPINGPLYNTYSLVLNAPTLQILCNDVSGELESYFMKSSRYQLADLQALIAQGGMSASNMIKYLTDLVMMECVTRRPGPDPPETAVKAYEAAMKYLTGIVDGTTILSFAEVQAAGLPLVYPMQIQDYAQDNMLTLNWRNSFGIRNTYRRPY